MRESISSPNVSLNRPDHAFGTDLGPFTYFLGAELNPEPNFMVSVSEMGLLLTEVPASSLEIRIRRVMSDVTVGHMLISLDAVSLFRAWDVLGSRAPFELACV